MWVPILNVHVTGMAENKRFPPAGGHDLDPLRLFSTVVLFQVFECSDVVNLNLRGHASGSALFANLGEESLFEF